MDLVNSLTQSMWYWQARLRLRDWDIQLIISPCTEGKAGFCRKLSDYKAAEITVATAESLPSSYLGNKDPEVTLVHELLHLQGEELDDFIYTTDGGRWKNHHERFIELTAIALVSARRDPISE